MLRAYIRDMTRMPILKPLAHTIIIGFQPATWPEAMTFNHRRGRRPPPPPWSCKSKPPMFPHQLVPPDPRQRELVGQTSLVNIVVKHFPIDQC